MSSITCNVFDPSSMKFAIGVPISLQCLSRKTAPFVSHTTSESNGCAWELTEFMNSLPGSEPVTWKVTFGIWAIDGKPVPQHQPALIYLGKGERYIITLEIRFGGGNLCCTVVSTRVTPAIQVL